MKNINSNQWKLLPVPKCEEDDPCCCFCDDGRDSSIRMKYGDILYKIRGDDIEVKCNRCKKDSMMVEKDIFDLMYEF